MTGYPTLVPARRAARCGIAHAKRWLSAPKQKQDSPQGHYRQTDRKTRQGQSWQVEGPVLARASNAHAGCAPQGLRCYPCRMDVLDPRACSPQPLQAPPFTNCLDESVITSFCTSPLAGAGIRPQVPQAQLSLEASVSGVCLSVWGCCGRHGGGCRLGGWHRWGGGHRRGRCHLGRGRWCCRS